MTQYFGTASAHSAGFISTFAAVPNCGRFLRLFAPLTVLGRRLRLFVLSRDGSATELQYRRATQCRRMAARVCARENCPCFFRRDPTGAVIFLMRV